MQIFLIFLILFHLAKCQNIPTVDRSLEEACAFMNSAFTPRTQPSVEAAVGDICEMKWDQMYTEDEEEAKEFCDLYAPWRLVKAKPGFPTVCVVEATYVCEDGWVQMYGRCLQMPRRLSRFTLSQGEEICRTSRQGGAQIAFMNRRYIVGVWERYFRGVEQIWVKASEGWEKFVIRVDDPKGEGLALAFTGQNYHFSVSNYGLIRVDPKVELHVLCEYIPPMTIAEVNYIGRRYSEIYWPSVPVKNGILIRSGTQYHNHKDMKSLDICKNILKPFMVTDVEQFLPVDDYLQELVEHKPMMSYSHGIAYNQKHWNQKNQRGCLPLRKRFIIKRTGLADYDRNITKGLECDIMKSSVIPHIKDVATIGTMSDPRTAPMWCKVGKIRKYKPNVPKGYTPYKRTKSGMMWAHKVVLEKKNFEDAEKHCQADGGHLTGFDDLEECKKVHELILAAQPDQLALFIGGKRKTTCPGGQKLPTYNADPCSQENVIQWQNNVANGPMIKEMWTYHNDDAKTPNPNYASMHQNCLTIIGLPPGWMNKAEGGYLDDVQCGYPRHFVCGKWVEMVEVE